MWRKGQIEDAATGQLLPISLLCTHQMLGCYDTSHGRDAGEQKSPWRPPAKYSFNLPTALQPPKTTARLVQSLCVGCQITLDFSLPLSLSLPLLLSRLESPYQRRSGKRFRQIECGERERGGAHSRLERAIKASSVEWPREIPPTAKAATEEGAEGRERGCRTAASAREQIARTTVLRKERWESGKAGGAGEWMSARAVGGFGFRRLGSG